MRNFDLAELVDELIPKRHKYGIVSFRKLSISSDPTDFAIAHAVNEYLSSIWQKSLVDVFDPAFRSHRYFENIRYDLNIRYPNLKNNIGRDLFDAVVAFTLNTLGKCEESSQHLYEEVSENYPGLECSLLFAKGKLSYFKEHYVLLVERPESTYSPATSWIVSPNNFVRYEESSMSFFFPEQYNSTLDCIKVTATQIAPKPTALALRILTNLEGYTGTWKVVQSTKQEC